MMTAEERAEIDVVLNEMQSELTAFRTMLSCFVINAIGASGNTNALDALKAQSQQITERRPITGLPPQLAQARRALDLRALAEAFEDLDLARAVMERVDDSTVN